MLHMDHNGELYEAPRKVIKLNSCNFCPSLTTNEANEYGNFYCDNCLTKEKGKPNARSAADIEIQDRTGTI